LRSNRKIARAKNSGGAAGGGAAPEQASGARRANTLKFDIFCKRPAKLGTLETGTPRKAQKHLQKHHFETQTFGLYARCPEKDRKTGLFVSYKDVINQRNLSECSGYRENLISIHSIGFEPNEPISII